jgi:hypothetical protein
MRTYLSLVLLLCPTAAFAQPVFFDDFNGNALLPHWNQPPPSQWAYNVSNSMLNVTGLFYPSSPESPINFTSMNALFAPQADFRMDVWMGWEAGDRPHRLNIVVLGGMGAGGRLAEFGFRDEADFSQIPVILADAGEGLVMMPAPHPGNYQFTITRVGRQFDFFFDGQPFASLPVTFDLGADGVAFDFGGPFPGQLGPLHIDRVQVIPAPGIFVLPFALIFRCARRRRQQFNLNDRKLLNRSREEGSAA